MALTLGQRIPQDFFLTVPLSQTRLPPHIWMGFPVEKPEKMHVLYKRHIANILPIKYVPRDKDVSLQELERKLVGLG